MTTDTQPIRLDGKETARQMRDETAAGCAAFSERYGKPPGLTVLLVGEDAASQIYVRNKEKAAVGVGIRSRVERLPSDASEVDVLAAVERLNRDGNVHGILVQLPLPRGIDEHRILQAIDPAKDVDGFHPENVGRLTIGLPGLVSCTPAGVIELLKRHEIPLTGAHAVVIGRSNIVGKPMGLLLLRENCTVTICHSRTRNLPQLCATGDILIAAVGRMGMVTAEFIKPRAVVVDVGIHRIEDEQTCRKFYGEDARRLAAVREQGATLIGDVHPLDARRRAGWLTPVPGGVGPLTIAQLLRNTLQAAQHAQSA